MKKPFRIHLDHETPFWIQHDATFFITICTEPRGFNQLCHEKQKWFCHLALLMPDHVHFILSFPDISSFSPVIGDWKRWLTMRQKIRWQENFFDHRLRKDEGFNQKADYILQNPVRAGFVEKFEDWPYIWISQGD